MKKVVVFLSMVLLCIGCRDPIGPSDPPTICVYVVDLTTGSPVVTVSDSTRCRVG
jgi:hypothetical protein